MTTLAHTPRWIVVAAVAAAATNVAIGLGTARGDRSLLLAFAIGLLPALVIVFGMLVESHRATVAWVALGLNLMPISFFTDPLPIAGGTTIYPTDVLLLAAVGAWVASRLSSVPARHPTRLSPALGWPLVLFAVTVLSGVAVGHERYGANIVGEPLRFVIYAAIALALTDVSVSSAWRAITIVFYTGAVVQSLLAVYYIATGTSQTRSDVLTTGGVRVLALSVAIYLTGSFVCALLNLELEQRAGRQLVHLVVAGLALFGIVVAFGRTTYAAVVLIVPLLILSRRYMRRTLLVFVPLFIPALVLTALTVTALVPSIAPTLESRFSGTSTNDSAVVWRERAKDSVLEGVDEEWLTGVGFGRETTFEMSGQVIRLRGDPHNSYIFLLAGGGVLALGSFLYVCGVFLIDAARRARRADPRGQALVIWSVSTWIAFMINALTGPIFTFPTIVMTMWILMALPSIVAVRAVRNPSD